MHTVTGKLSHPCKCVLLHVDFDIEQIQGQAQDHHRNMLLLLVKADLYCSTLSLCPVCTSHISFVWPSGALHDLTLAGPGPGEASCVLHVASLQTLNRMQRRGRTAITYRIAEIFVG